MLYTLFRSTFVRLLGVNNMLLLELPQRPSLLSKSHHTNVNYFRLFSNCSPRSLPFRRPVPWDDVLQSIPSVPVQPYFPFDLIHINFQFPLPTLVYTSPSQQTFRTSGYSISGTLVPEQEKEEGRIVFRESNQRSHLVARRLKLVR